MSLDRSEIARALANKLLECAEIGYFANQWKGRSDYAMSYMGPVQP